MIDEKSMQKLFKALPYLGLMEMAFDRAFSEAEKKYLIEHVKSGESFIGSFLESKDGEAAVRAMVDCYCQWVKENVK